MQTVTTIGLDIAKSVFQVHGVDAEGNRSRSYGPIMLLPFGNTSALSCFNKRFIATRSPSIFETRSARFPSIERSGSSER